MANREWKPDWITRAAAFISAAVFLFGLAWFAYAGTFSRFWADDYCYSATVKQLGLFNGLLDWYRHSGNRLSTLVMVAFSDLFGPGAIRWTALAVLTVWIGAWVFCLRQLFRLLDRAVALPWLLLFSVMEVYFAALLAPDRLQTIYWRMGTFHYTLPMPLLLINLGILAGTFCLPPKRAGWALLGSGLLALFAAGLSETFAAMQAGLFGLLIVAALVFLRGARRGLALRLLAAPLAGTLVTMIMMTQAPANEWRQAVMPPPDNLLLIAPMSLRFAADFVFYTLRGQVIPFVVFLAAAGAAAIQVFRGPRTQLAPRALLAGMAGALLVTYLLIVCSFSPSAYAALSYPAGRALMPASAVLLAGLATTAVLAGILIGQLVPTAWQGRLAAAALVVMLAASLYPLRAAAIPRGEVAQLSVRAGRWDARDAQIRAALAAGQRDIQVRQVDVVQSLEDMGPDPTQWINACATIYYGARSITANP